MKILMFLLVTCVAVTSTFAMGSPSPSSGGSKSSTSSGPVTASDWYNLGYKLSQAEKYSDALADFKKAISLNANYAEAYNMLGYCTRKLGNATEAFTYYDKALSLKPNFPEAREYYGEAYLQAGDLTKAVQQYVLLQKQETRTPRNSWKRLTNMSTNRISFGYDGNQRGR